jgi:hypothetical protein
MTPLVSMHAELLRLRCAVAAANFELKAKQLHRAIQAKFNPDQPRVPAGSPGGGQWASGGGNHSEQDGPLVSFAAARRRGQSEAFCWNQLTIDNLLCSSLMPASRREICRAQAKQRYAACITGSQIPPLSY